ncbi:hypothetical protein E5D57_000271 [Metarhizium anisopliae]|nr:hypothetical protein E5D57_000271 [Metarhizium anisopliae]
MDWRCGTLGHRRSCHDVAASVPAASNQIAQESHSLMQKSGRLATPFSASREATEKDVNPSDDLDMTPNSSFDLEINVVVLPDQPDLSSLMPPRSPETSYPMPMDDFARLARPRSAPGHLGPSNAPSVSKSKETPVEGRLRRNRLFLAWLGRGYREVAQAAEDGRQAQGLLDENIIATDFATRAHCERCESGTTEVEVSTTQVGQAESASFVDGADESVLPRQEGQGAAHEEKHSAR